MTELVCCKVHEQSIVFRGRTYTSEDLVPGETVEVRPLKADGLVVEVFREGVSVGEASIETGPRHQAGLRTAAIIRTPCWQLARAAVESVIADGSMGAIHGDPGLGKTFAVESALRHIPDRARLDPPPRPTPRQLSEDLLYRLTGVSYSGSRSQLARALMDELSARRPVVMVDEAQRLGTECAEHMRWLYDQVGFPLLFVGGHRCWAVLSGHQMLRSRITAVVEFEPMSEKVLLQILPKYHALYQGCQAETILFVNEECARGNFRDWAKFTAGAVKLCERNNLPLELTEEVARGVFALLPGGSG